MTGSVPGKGSFMGELSAVTKATFQEGRGLGLPLQIGRAHV